MEVKRRILAGLSQSLVLGAMLLEGQLFCLKPLNEQCIPYLLGHTVKYLRKDGITLLLEVFMGKRASPLSAYSTTDHTG